MPKKYLIVSGCDPFEGLPFQDYFEGRSSFGGNPGNLLFINAVVKSLMTSEKDVFVPTWYRFVFSDKDVSYINANFDAFILPLADAFRDGNQHVLKGYSSLIRRLKIPCHVIGVGLRTYGTSPTDAYPFDEAAREFVSAILDKSPQIGTRGFDTAEYIRHLGFPESCVHAIGCPSVSVFCNRLPRPFNYARDKKVVALYYSQSGLNCRRLPFETAYPTSCESFFDDVTYIFQDPTELPYLFYGRNPCKMLFSKEHLKILAENGRIKFFSNLWQWISFVATRDLCVSGRFHGSIVSLAAQTPVLFAPTDGRTFELAKFHNLTCVSPEEMKTKSLREILEEKDFSSHMKVWERNMKNYAEFLSRLGLESIHFNRTDGAEFSPYDRRIASIVWPDSPKTFLEISSVRRFLRQVERGVLRRARAHIPRLRLENRPPWEVLSGRRT